MFMALRHGAWKRLTGIIMPLLERFRRIAERPYLYQPVDFVCEGYRRSMYGEHSIYYRIVDNAVENMATFLSQDTDAAL
jgi:toxin ParE1/3/4